MDQKDYAKTVLSVIRTPLRKHKRLKRPGIGRRWAYNCRKALPVWIQFEFALSWESLFQLLELLKIHKTLGNPWETKDEEVLVKKRVNILWAYERLDGNVTPDLSDQIKPHMEGEQNECRSIDQNNENSSAKRG